MAARKRNVVVRVNASRDAWDTVNDVIVQLAAKNDPLSVDEATVFIPAVVKQERVDGQLKCHYLDWEAMRQWCDLLPRYPEVKVAMVGEDGNAFAVMGRVTQAMRRAGLDKMVSDEYMREAMSGNYDALLATTMRWVEVDAVGGDDGEEW